MLKKLNIQNYAIIETLELELEGRLNILTGETGAGKSILMGALSLILGDRADTSVLLNRDKKSVVEGTFLLSKNSKTKAILLNLDLDAEEELVIRREMAASGKTRAFVNDTPVNLEQLREVSHSLVDLHRQFDTLELGEQDFQREILDALANNQSLLEVYRMAFSGWQSARKKLIDLQSQKQQFTREYDYNKFLHDELEEAAFKENELEEAEEELKLLGNAEGIRSALSKSNYLLSEGEEPVLNGLKSISSALAPFASLKPSLPELLQRLDSTYIELKDLALEFSSMAESVMADPERMDWLNQRLALGYKLLKKHGVKSTAELLNLKNDLASKLQTVLELDDTIALLQKQEAAQEEMLLKLASQLSLSRKNVVPDFEAQVNRLLAQVGMPNAHIQVLVSAQNPSLNGADNVDLLFDANKSGRFEPIRKVASGGELSRLMLCIKSLVAASLDLPTLIFDEIDTGISGEAARQVGIILKNLAAQRQVICITHQPQIAGRADAHYFVYKAEGNVGITTGIRKLVKQERIEAIARMLGGDPPTSAALENAREMVNA
jgi:DNA repair protein RecN (Recombination protein N)